MNSFASSASSGSITTNCSVSSPNSAPARFCPRSVREDTICGRVKSSSIALCSAIRSGQNATSRSRPRPAMVRSTSAVTPGNTVLRNTSSWPSRKYGSQSDNARGMACGSGLRCSSTGVPITTITFSAVATTAGSVDALISPAARPARSNGSAPGSMNGRMPALTRSTASCEMSCTTTDAPRWASAMASGRPTWPPPPTTTTSAVNPAPSLVCEEGIVFSDPCRHRRRAIGPWARGNWCLLAGGRYRSAGSGHPFATLPSVSEAGPPTVRHGAPSVPSGSPPVVDSLSPDRNFAPQSVACSQ